MNILGCFKFLFLTRLYETDYVLDQLLIDGLRSGIKSIKYPCAYYTKIKFYNGTKVNAWNANKYYAYFQKGKINKYKWNESMPSRKVLRMLYYSIVDYNKEEALIQIQDF